MMKRYLPDDSTLQVLFVEDHLGDTMLVMECFRRGRYPVSISHVPNGEECLKFLAKTGSYARVPTPHLVLMDLILPEMGGQDVMAALLADERFCHLPVVVLSSVSHPDFIREMYALRCNTYIIKPWDLNELEHIIDMIGRYWLDVATLPKTI